MGQGSQRADHIVVSKNIRLLNRQLPIHDIEKFSLNAPNITFPKDTSTHGPVYILQCSIVNILKIIIREKAKPFKGS
jgi:hypothetical protein